MIIDFSEIILARNIKIQFIYTIISRSNLSWVAPFNIHLAQSFMALFLYPKRGDDRMADNFGLKIGLEGEKEFKKSLAEINQSFKVIGSEMKLVSSQFDKNDNSIQALSARNTVLNKEIDAQKQKIETLRQALANASESFGETDRRTQSWQIQLNNAEASLNGMEHELNSKIINI